MANIGSIQTAKGEIFTNAHVLSQSRAGLGYFVLSGCDVNQSGTPGMSVIVDSGYIQVGWGTAQKTVAGGTVVITAAHPTLPRIDTIYIDSNGTARVYDGTATAISPGDKTNFKQMSTPAPGTNIPNGVIIALVYVAAGDTSITNAEILDIATYGALVAEAPTTTTSGKIPYWSSTAKTLSDGYTVGTTANCLLQLDSSARIPAVSGALLTSISHSNLTNLLTDDHTQYIKHALATSSNDFLVSSGSGAFVKKTLAETKTVLGLGSAAYTASTDYAPAAQGVTNGNTHDHSGGDGAQIDHGGLAGLADNDHPQYIRHSLATAVNDFIVASGSGAYIKKTLAEVKTILGLGSAAYTAAGDYTPVAHASNTSNPHSVTYSQVGAAPAAKGITNGDSHNHSGGDGAQIAYSSLSGLPLRGVDFAFGDGSGVLIAQACCAKIPAASTIKKAFIRSLDTDGGLKSGSVTCTIYIHDYSAAIGSAVDAFALASASNFSETGLSIAVAAGKCITCILSGITTVEQIVLSLEMEAA